MGKLKPIGSEKLEGMEKITRIMEIARYNENIPNSINENKSVEYNKVLADGNNYQIVKERNGYVIKKTLSESTGEGDYLDPMKNRKYYSSYSQAFKRLNLIAKEINVNEGQENNVNLFFESSNDATKYILKIDATEQVAPAAAPVPSPAPAPAPSPAPAPAPEEELDLPEPEEDMDLGNDQEMDDEVVNLKVIQKLTGKLAQKLRILEDNEEENLSSKDVKYVINSILSALDLESLEEEDKEDIMNKLEGIDDENPFDGGNDEMVDDEMGDDEMGNDELQPEVPSGEMGEAMYGSFGNLDRKDFKGDKYFDEKDRPVKDSDLYGIGGDEFDTEEFKNYKSYDKKYPKDSEDSPKWFGNGSSTTRKKMFDTYAKTTGKPFKVKTRKEEMENDHSSRMEEMIEGLFSESKVDSILQKYFKINEKEKQILESKIQKSTLLKEDRKEKINNIKRLSESISQEVASTKVINKYPEAKLIGKTNKNNLVFEMNNKQLRVNTKGQIL